MMCTLVLEPYRFVIILFQAFIITFWMPSLHVAYLYSAVTEL